MWDNYQGEGRGTKQLVIIMHCQKWTGQDETKKWKIKSWVKKPF